MRVIQKTTPASQHDCNEDRREVTIQKENDVRENLRDRMLGVTDCLQI